MAEACVCMDNIAARADWGEIGCQEPRLWLYLQQWSYISEAILLAARRGHSLCAQRSYALCLHCLEPAWTSRGTFNLRVEHLLNTSLKVAQKIGVLAKALLPKGLNIGGWY